MSGSSKIQELVYQVDLALEDLALEELREGSYFSFIVCWWISWKISRFNISFNSRRSPPKKSQAVCLAFFLSLLFS